MKYHNIKEGIFVSRPNRFVAYVEIAGNVEICHVKNTGRCKELWFLRHSQLEQPRGET